jgi:dTDP-4-amino-4,6-dideoxygalactose transaminase
MSVKATLTELAVFGGPPAFREPLHVGCPNVGDRDRFLKRVADILERRRLTNDGPYVRAFEERVAAIAGVRHCVATCNGTMALQIAGRALGLAGAVIVPSFTFVATVHALQWQSITPVFCDIDRHTFNIDPDRAAALITPRTTGIIGVHLWGRPCATDRLERLARERGLVLLYDASHAFGCSHQGRSIGGFGRAEVFSFHATKFVNTLEGGAIVTNDEGLARTARQMRNFGFVGQDRVERLGINGKMNEVSAAMGLTCLEDMDAFIAAGRRTHHAYRQALGGIPGVTLLPYDEGERCNWQYVVVEIDEKAGLGRDALWAVLQRENVLARRYYYPGCHRLEPYRSADPEAGRRLPETERAAARVLCLPTGAGVDEQAVATIADLIHFAVEHGAEITERLRRRDEGGRGPV